MKNRKSIISLLLVLCICLSSLAMFASAADTEIGPKALIRVVTCQVSAAYFCQTGNENGIIGQLMRGEEFHTSSESTATWYYGIPGPTTALAAQFPGVKGYIKATAFSKY